MGNISLGRYVPGDSLVHRLDPRVKVLLTIAFMVAVFFIDTYWAYLLYFALAALIFRQAGISLRQVVAGLRPLLFFMIFTFLINLFTGQGQPLFSLGALKVTRDGIHRAVFISLRVILLVVGSTVMTLTTSPIQMADALESLLSPLRLIHFPAGEVGMMISIALRFIPTLYEESQKIMKAQQARGADFGKGRLVDRVKSMIPLMVPLFVNAMERSQELGTAMEARCYTGDDRRTRLNPLVFEKKDWLSLLAGLAVFFLVGYFL